MLVLSGARSRLALVLLSPLSGGLVGLELPAGGFKVPGARR